MREQRDRLANEVHRREEAERELLEREETLRMAADSGNVGIWDFNPLTGEHKWSARSKTMFGLLPDADVNAVAFLERVHPEDRDRVDQAMQAALEPSGGGKYEVEYRITWPDETVHWILARGQAIFEGENASGRASRGIGTVIDITERKHVEEVIRASESRLQAMMDNTSAVIYLKDSLGRYLMVNRRYEELFNVTQQQIAGKTDADIFPSDVVAKLQTNDRQVRETGQPFEFEEVVPHSDRPHTYVSVKFPIRDSNGTVVAIGGISTDITDRKAVEDVIRDSESRLRGILNNTPAVISLKDLNGRYVLVNRGWEELYGVSNDEIVGLTNDELLSKSSSPHMSPRIANQFVAIDHHVIRSGKAIEFEDPLPIGNDQRVFATVKFPIKDATDQITGIGGISIDITERRKAADLLAAEQETLRHTIEFQDQERELLSYEIHDGLVQYATGALMQLEGIRHQLESGTDAAQIERVVEILRRAVAEGRRLVNGIHTPVLNDWGVVAALEQLIGETDRAHLRIKFIKDQALGRLAPRLEETLYRITQEALTNTQKHSQSKKAQIELLRRGDRIHLEIRDWGIGFVPSHSLSGTHGLSGIRNRAKISGGQCTIESVPGEGTKIVIDLPYSNKA